MILGSGPDGTLCTADAGRTTHAEKSAMKMALAEANRSNCTALSHPTREMVWIEGGEFRMGSDAHYPEEAPAHRVRVNSFWQGAFPHENPQVGRVRPHLAGDRIPAERLRRLRHDRQCVGVDQRLVLTQTRADAHKPCCIPDNPRGGRQDTSYDPCQPEIKIPRKVLKGGSHLCAPNYCRRYRPAARHPEPVDTSTTQSVSAASCVRRERRCNGIDHRRRLTAGNRNRGV